MMKWFCVAMLAFGLTPIEAFAGGGHGHPGPGKHRRGMKAKALHMALKKADLSDEQQEQMKALFQKHKATMKKLRQNKRAAIHPVMVLLQAEDPNTVSFQKIRQQREQFRLKMEKLNFRHLKAVISLLEPEQRQKVAQELGRMKTQWKSRHKRRQMRRWKQRRGHHHGGAPDDFGPGPDGEFDD